MFRVMLLSPVITTVMASAYIDSDMDGVEDKDDLCLNTSMTDLVDTTGCTIKHLISPPHFSIELGLSQSSDDDYSTTLPSLALNYRYEDFSLHFSTSYFNLKSDTYRDNGLNDSYLNLYYKLYKSDKLSLTFGAGAIMPTYNGEDNRFDYTTSLYGKYIIDNFSLSAGLGYTLMNDTNSSNALSYSVSGSYVWSGDFYSTLGYANSESIYGSETNYESLYLRNYYKINKNWFTTLSLTKGLNSLSVDNSIGATVGYAW